MKEGRKGGKGGREEKEEKKLLKKKGHRQEFTTREILNDKMKAASYKLELLVKIELPPGNKNL